jgi:hypothetical protein
VAVGNDSQPLEAQQTSTPSPAAETLQPKQDVEALSVTRTVPSTIEAEAGKESPFSITLNSADPPPRSIITIQGLPEGTTLSDGRPYGDGGWTLKPDEVSDLRLRLPKGVSGHTNLRIALVGADGSPIAGAATQLNVANPPISRPEEKELVAGLIAHGQKMIDVGYLAGARGYFKRAAEAGSADAALAHAHHPDTVAESGQTLHPQTNSGGCLGERRVDQGVPLSTSPIGVSHSGRFSHLCQPLLGRRPLGRPRSMSMVVRLTPLAVPYPSHGRGSPKLRRPVRDKALSHSA